MAGPSGDAERHAKQRRDNKSCDDRESCNSSSHRRNAFCFDPNGLRFDCIVLRRVHRVRKRRGVARRWLSWRRPPQGKRKGIAAARPGCRALDRIRPARFGVPLGGGSPTALDTNASLRSGWACRFPRPSDLPQETSAQRHIFRPRHLREGQIPRPSVRSRSPGAWKHAYSTQVTGIRFSTPPMHEFILPVAGHSIHF